MRRVKNINNKPIHVTRINTSAQLRKSMLMENKIS